MGNEPEQSVFFLGNGEIYAEIAQHVADLNVLGCLRTSYWIDVNNDPVNGPIRVFDSHTKAKRFIDVDELVEDTRPPVILVSLEELEYDELHVANVERWHGEFRDRFNGGVVPIRILMHRQPLQSHVPAGGRGWATFALASEDNEHPRAPFNTVDRDNDPYEAAKVFGPSLVTLFGLWKDSSSVPILDDNKVRGLCSDEEFRLVRCYYRGLETGVAEQKLLKDVVDIREKIPRLVTDDGVETDYTGQIEELTEYYSQDLVDSSKDNLLSKGFDEDPESEIDEETAKKNDSFLKDYFNAVVKGGWKRLKPEPPRGLAIVGKAREALADYDNEATDKPPIPTDTDSKATIEDIQESARCFKRSPEAMGIEVGEQTLFPDFWREYVNTSFILVDSSASDRASRDKHTRNPVIVSRPDQVVPDVSDGFKVINPAAREVLNGYIAHPGLLPFDPHSAWLFEARLRNSIKRGSSPEIIEERARFQEWKLRMSQSYAWKTGELLLEKLRTAQQRSDFWIIRRRRLLEDLKGKGGEAKSHKAPRMGIVEVVFRLMEIAALIFASYCFARNYFPSLRFFAPEWEGISLVTFLLVLVAIVAVDMVFCIPKYKFLQRERDIVRLKIEVETSTGNFFSAAEDVEKMASAYQQFISWNILLGRALNYPYGRVAEVNMDFQIPLDGLPQSVKIGKVSIPDDVKRTLKRRLQMAMFSSGWAGQRWKEFSRGKLESFSAKRDSKSYEISDFFGLPGNGSNSLLDLLAKEVLGSTPDEFSWENTTWQSAFEKVVNEDKSFKDKLMVSYFEHKENVEEPLAQFVEKIEAAHEEPAGFRRLSLSPSATDRIPTEVDPDYTVFIKGNTGCQRLADSRVLVEFGNRGQLECLATEQVSSGVDHEDSSKDRAQARLDQGRFLHSLSIENSE